MNKHRSDSGVQQSAESLIIDWLEIKLGLKLERNVSLPLGDARVVVDAADANREFFVEAFARQGKLAAGQKDKLASDVLKLCLVHLEYPDSSRILAVADGPAERWLTGSGWVATSVRENGIEVVRSELTESIRSGISEAQRLQRMDNVF